MVECPLFKNSLSSKDVSQITSGLGGGRGDLYQANHISLFLFNFTSTQTSDLECKLTVQTICLGGLNGNKTQMKWRDFVVKDTSVLFPV